MGIYRSIVYRLIIKSRNLYGGPSRTLRNGVALTVLLMIFGYLTSRSSQPCQSTDSQCRNYNKVISTKILNQSRESVWTGSQSDDVMPAMVEYPRVHVVTSGSENLETRETVVVYFYWCGERVFRFRNYMSVLSAIYVVKPSKIIFLHTHDMFTDDNRYNTWFLKLTETVPYLATMNIGSDYACDIDISDSLFGLVPEEESSIFIGSNTIMTEFPVHLRKSNMPVGSARKGSDDGFLYIKRGKKEPSFKADVSNCVSKDDFDGKDGNTCIILDKYIIPKDIWTLDTPFGRLARTLVYRLPKRIQPRKDFKTLAPRIAHYFWFGSKKFTYGNYLSALSALHVAGLDRAYFHGVKPQGYHFQKLLQEENVTHIYMPELKYIYNHRLRYTTHNADIGKLYVLSRYGGVTQDGDIFWTRRISDEILAYDAVVSFDWPSHGEFPEVFNLGVLIGKPNAFYFKALLSAMRDYRDDTVYHLAMRLPYKTYEQYPSTLHTERHLQVICWLGKCHPSWLPNYIQPLSGDAPGMGFDWKTDTSAVHCTWPKPPTEMQDFDTLKTADGLFAEIGRNILRKARKL